MAVPELDQGGRASCGGLRGGDAEPPIQIRRPSPAVTEKMPDRTQNPDPLVSPGAAASEPSLPALDLDGVRRRDPDALAALFDRYFDRLYAVVYRMLGNRAETEDAIQEVFLKVHRGAPSLDATRDPGPWLITIAANVSRDRWRSGASRLDRA